MRTSGRREAPGTSTDATSLAQYKDAVNRIRTAYPDLKLVLDETIHLPNAAIIRWTATGTNTGPTGKSVRNTGMDLVRFMDGKVTETLVYFDTGDWMTQLGYTFVPPAAE